MINDDQFEVLPQEIFSHVLSFLPTEKLVGLSLVGKNWKNTIDDLLNNPDLITSLTQDLSEDEVGSIIQAYQTKKVYQYISESSYQTKSPWHFLNYAMTLATTEEVLSNIPNPSLSLPNAFLSVVSKLPVELIANFIINFNLTSCGKAFLKIPKDSNYHQTLCHALLCTSIKEIDGSKLKEAILWAKSTYINNEGMQSLLNGLEVTLKVRNGDKNLPKKSSYYINLRGANLANADLRDTDFRLMDLQFANLYSAKLSTEISLRKTAGLISFAYLLNFLPDPGAFIRWPLAIILLGGHWLTTNSKDASNLAGVNLQNADLQNVEFGRSNLQNTKLSNCKLGIHLDAICEATLSNAIFFDNHSATTINTALDNLLPYVNIANLEEAVAKNIVAQVKKMSLNEAIDTLQAAIKHPFFSPAVRKRTTLDRLSNFNLMIKSGQSFFRSFNLKGKQILNTSLNEIKNNGLPINSKPTLKRKFSI